MRKNIILYLSIGLLLVVFLLSSCNKGKVVKAQRKSITEAVYASGYIVPKNEYKVYALADGYIIAKYKADGDSIKKGEAIYKVENNAYAARLSASNSSFKLAKKNTDENSPVLADLKNKIRTAESKLMNDSMNYVRNKNAIRPGAVIVRYLG